MAEISFYHLQRTPLEKSLPRLLEKVLASGLRSVIWCRSAEQVEQLNQQLWTYTTHVFLPHGSKADGYVDQQPIFLTDQLENPNKAAVLALVDGQDIPFAEAEQKQFSRFLYMFDGNDEAATKQVRTHWQVYSKAGHTLTYWKQNSEGVWEKGA